jgi:hypothetical protein
MSNAPQLPMVLLLYALCVPAQSPAPDASGKAVVLQKDEGDLALAVRVKGLLRPAAISC